MKERFSYQTGREVLTSLLEFQTSLKVEGKENLPKKGPLIVAFNHPFEKAYLEYLVFPTIFPWKLVSLSLSASLYRLPTQKILTFCEKRGFTNLVTISGLPGAEMGIRKAKKTLFQGEPVLISPEGKGTPTGELIRGKPGIAWLAEQTQAPILPLAIITNPNRKPSDILIPKRVEIGVSIGQAFHQKRPREKPDRAWYQEQADKVMYRIAALLPPAMRGCYSDIPKSLQIQP